MKILRQMGIIMLICFCGQMLEKIFKLPIPGNVLGMIILLICLLTGIIKVNMIEDICKFLIDHLAFLFLPAGVGIITCMGFSALNWVYIGIICLFSTIIVMVTTGYVVQLMKRS